MRVPNEEEAVWRRRSVPQKELDRLERLIEQYEADSAQPANHSTKVARDSTPSQDTPQFRRAVPRQPVDWVARFRLHDDPTGYWRACRISDISTAGAGLKLFGVSSEDLDGRTIDVSVQLVGEVRNTVEGTDNDTRVGIEFVDLAADPSSYVESLKHSETRW